MRHFDRILWAFSLLGPLVAIAAGSQEARTPAPPPPHAPAPSLAIPHDEWRRSLPPGLREQKGAPLHRIYLDGVVIYLLGSSHVSRTSCDDARLLMSHVRPDVLFVELCSQRVGMLLDPPASSESDVQPKEQSADSSPLARGSLLFTKIQSDYANKLNVTIGGEMKTAFQSAVEQERKYWASQPQRTPWGVYGSSLQPLTAPTTSLDDYRSNSHPRGNRPCSVVLGDRPVQITLLRAWESLRIFGKIKLMLALLWSSIKQPSEKELREWMESLLSDRTGKSDLLTKSMEELGKAFPSLKQVILDERDAFMTAKLRQTAEALQYNHDGTGEKVIVALVGAGHCQGMMKKLSQRNDAISILPNLLETKKRKVGPEELSSLVTDIVQFDYSYIWGPDQ